MKTLLVLVFSALVSNIASAAPPQPSNAPSDVKAIKQLEQDIGDAMVALDTEKLRNIWADDWVATGASGKTLNKETALRRFGSGATHLRSFELGPIDVQVFGDVAICQGSSTESKTRDGKDISGTYVWIDILKKRGGRWVIVQSVTDVVS